ncbi:MULTISPECIES: hypothetical protein [Actinomadura]|uniref:hypothetical protein n=1 Tax=Actinomadura TaxID=1988 RepID=UPI002E29F685|nr:hypothetical protein [Actinomadura citrea]
MAGTGHELSFHLECGYDQAHARRAFAIAGLVSDLLDEHALPARDVCPVGTFLRRAAERHLDRVPRPHLIER